MEHLIAILGIATLCGIWARLQMSTGRAPRMCSRAAACHRECGDCNHEPPG